MKRPKTWKRPKRPDWIERAVRLIDEAEPLAKQSTLRLLKRALGEYALHYETLALIAEHLTTDEGDAKATEHAFGLDANEVVAMAHDEMIIKARIALKPTSKIRT